MLPIFSASCVLCAAVHASGSWRAHRFGWFLFRSSIILARNHYYLLLPVRPSENLWFRSKELWWGWRSYVALPFHVSCSEDAWDHSPSLIHQSLAESMLHPRPPLGGASEGCFVPFEYGPCFPSLHREQCSASPSILAFLSFHWVTCDAFCGWDAAHFFSFTLDELSFEGSWCDGPTAFHREETSMWRPSAGERHHLSLVCLTLSHPQSM